MRIAIAEDHALFREGLVLQLARAGQQVVVEAGTGEELLVMAGQHPVDVAILDVRLPPTFADEGLRAAEELAARSPDIAILLLSAYAETAYATRLFAGGTARRGYLLKERVDNAAALCDALDRICAGESVLDDSIVQRLFTRQQHLNRLSALTERECAVLQHMAEGRSNAGHRPDIAPGREDRGVLRRRESSPSSACPAGRTPTAACSPSSPGCELPRRNEAGRTGPS